MKLKYFIKKIIRAFLCLWCCTLFINNVNAADNSINGAAYGTDLILPSYAIFMNNFGSSISRVSTYVASNGFYDYADYTTLANSYGGGIAFNTNNTLRGNSFYAFTIYVGMENGGTSLSSVYAVHSSVSDRVVVASSFDGLIDRYSRNDYNATYVTSKDFLNPIIIKNSSTLSNFSGVLQYIIKVGSAGGNFIFIPYTTNVNFYNRHIFFGYSIEFLGSQDNGITTNDVRNVINSSGLATANSVSQVQQGINEVKSSLSTLTQAQQETNNTIKDETAPTVDLSDVNLTSTTPISDLLTLPLSLLNTYLNAFSGTCTNYTLPLPFNHSVTLNCFTIGDVVGSNVAYIIDMAICLFMAYEIVLLFIKIFEDMTSLSDTYTNWVKRGRY